jgi:hypothetical protein
MIIWLNWGLTHRLIRGREDTPVLVRGAMAMLPAERHRQPASPEGVWWIAFRGLAKFPGGRLEKQISPRAFPFFFATRQLPRIEPL